MGKVKQPTPKKNDNKQAKISSFFQTSTNKNGETNSDKQSALFTSLKQNKAKCRLILSKNSSAASVIQRKSATVKPRPESRSSGTTAGKGKLVFDFNPKNTEKKNGSAHSSELSVHGAGSVSSPIEIDCIDNPEDLQKTKALLLQASQIIKGITEGSTLVGSVDESPDHVTCVPETQVDSSFPSPGLQTAARSKKRQSIELESGSENESSIIPDTPQPEKNDATTKKKKKTFRSFLSCSSNLNTSNTLHHKLKHTNHGKRKTSVTMQQKTRAKVGPRSLEDALKSVENDLEFASPESFNAMLTGVGFGHSPVIPVKNPSSDCHDDSSKTKLHSRTVGSLSGVKRCSVDGSSPNAKRLMRKTPTKAASSPAKHEQCYAEKVGIVKSPKIRKFSRNLLHTSFSKNMLIKECGFPQDSTEKAMNLDADDDLSELLEQYQTVQPSVRNKASLPQTRTPPQTLMPTPSVAIPAHDEPDEALDDIILELRGTLTQSNSKDCSHLGGSILSEGVSTCAVQPAKRCIPIEERKHSMKSRHTMQTGSKSIAAIATDAVTTLDNGKCNTDYQTKPVCDVVGSDEDNNLDLSEIICGVKNNNSKGGDLFVNPSRKPEMEVNEGRDDFGISDLQFEEAALALDEEFGQLSPFKQESLKCSEPEDDAPCVHFGRCQVQAVIREGMDVHLELLTDPRGEQRRAFLTGFWSDVVIAKGDIVHIVGDFDASGHIRLSDCQNLLIVHPDLLISGTSVVGGIHCMRRAVLNERFKGYDSMNIHMLYGTIIHSFFQQVVQRRCFTPDAMETVMTSVLQKPRVLQDMYAQGVGVETVMGEIQKYVPQLQAWAAKYLTSGRQQPGSDLAISRIVDIEENVWSPRYGIKGKIDLTVEVKIHDKKQGTQTKLMPLELKTGRPTHSVEHKGQVTLYSMMCGDRRADPGAGLLLYLKDGSMSTVPADHAHKRGLVQLRNELAHHLAQSIMETQGSGMPAPINSARSCAKCPQLINCASYQKVLGESPVGEAHAMTRLVPETLAHLSDRHLEFYRLWVRLMMLEMATGGATGTALADLWCKTGWQREQQGLCLSRLVLVPDRESCVESATGHFRQTFTRMRAHPATTQLDDVGIVVRDNLVVSAENQPLLALSMGAVSAITDNTVTLLLDRDLNLVDKSSQLVFRLDKADTYNTMATNMTNLARLMENNDRSTRLRQIVIEKRTPEFETTMSKGVIEQVKGIFKRLNKPQKMAILKVLMCKDYVLIKGYPGTGKTSTIVSLVRILTLLGRSVLLTSYTHSAVDNILLKLIKHDVDFTRLGRASRIHPDVQPYSAELQALKIKTVEELSQFYESKAVVAATCLGAASHPVLLRRTFDVCIVDEASQVLQPACLGPLFSSRRFVLVGDPLQLPPVVQSHEASDAGMAESLFARLDDTGGTYELNMQYRMNADIMRLSNELVYSGALRCGNEAVAQAQLVLPDNTPLSSAPEWLRKALNPDTHIMFLDTSKVPPPESNNQKGGVENQTEAALVRLIVDTCIKVALVRGLLQRHHLGGVEVNTVDQYQGRDKNCVIMSFVKHTPGQVGGILEDLRRLNVALTRARHKLLLLGHVTVLSSYSPLRAVLAILRPHQMLQLLPDDVTAATSIF